MAPPPPTPPSDQGAAPAPAPPPAPAPVAQGNLVPPPPPAPPPPQTPLVQPLPPRPSRAPPPRMVRRPAVVRRAPAVPVAARPGPPANLGTISDIRIEGLQRIEPETVRSYLLLQPGDPWDPGRVDSSLKALFATGLFADVKLDRQGNTLVVKVVENPIINRISFEGNDKLSEKDLTNEIQLRPRVVYTRSRVQNDVRRILDLYRRHARFAATVEPKVIQLSENRVDLVFEINEGPSTTVRSINFVGNKEFSDSTLRGVVDTKENRWYRFLSNADTYDPDRITYDRELLRKYYLSQGYADFRVVSAIAELTPDRDGFIVTFTVDEGERYKFGKVDVNIKLKDLPKDQVLPLLKVQSGDWYDANAVERSISTLTDALGNRGYAFVEIKPQITRNRDARTIDITFDVQEGPQVYVERIDIVGNVRTLDKVIRREMRLVEGDAFNSNKLQRSKDRIKNLGFFKKVETNTAQGSAPDRTVVTVEVEEQSTGELSLGVGFSTTDGPLADITLRERNFLGRGQDVQIGTVVSFRSQQVNLSFTEPYFLDSNIAAGFDLFEIKTSPTASFFSGITPAYQQFSYGGALRTGYQLTENLRQTLKYTARSDDITDVQSDASLFIALEQGTHTTSSIGQVLLYDRRDNRIDPTSGWYASLGNDFAGVGFGVDYVRNKLSAGYYYPLWPGWVVSVTGEAGDIFGWNGQPVLLQDRFFVGGDNLRGFAPAGIGPRDIVSQDALGGNKYYVGSVALGVPLGLPKELGLSGRVWSDFGSLWSNDQKNATFTAAQLAQEPGGQAPQVVDSPAIRLSAGIGLTWVSPVGPIKVDLGLPVIRQSYDKSQFFRVSFGTKF
ncbi:MAG TPA: outer membrane protein assembly factor BamA [Stellaceae bacterium]|nr:outer membrane protein assembly factor BamA [Stellaceae bacterium]